MFINEIKEKQGAVHDNLEKVRAARLFSVDVTACSDEKTCKIIFLHLNRGRMSLL